jgi:hypothetical protein
MYSPSTPAAASSLDTWPATARTGYVVRSRAGDERRVVVGTDGTLVIEGVGSYEIVEEVRVAERRAGLRALAEGRI